MFVCLFVVVRGDRQMQSYLEEEAAKSPSLSLWAGEETGDSRGRLQQQLQQQRQQQQQRRCPLVFTPLESAFVSS